MKILKWCAHCAIVLVLARSPAIAGTLCVEDSYSYFRVIDCDVTAAYPADWMGFSTAFPTPTSCTTCGCGLPEFCQCCPYDDAGCLCDCDTSRFALFTISRSEEHTS